MRIEHSLSGAKRVRVLRDILRNFKPDFSDMVMELGCGLHNLRVRERKRRLRKL